MSGWLGSKPQKIGANSVAPGSDAAPTKASAGKFIDAATGRSKMALLQVSATDGRQQTAATEERGSEPETAE